ncbi:MAG: hypothetical protein EOP45_10640 [Sphingobacteriaceae bacterium]|nr:MAG: hypothetical protein EOP45_10640 [Sphingobacteriaceae bacterium]
MIYYFDTNAVYNIRKVPAEILESSFTSALSLIELISGIKDLRSYNKRKSIITQIYSLQMTIDWAMPEEIIFNSFDIFWDDEFVDSRIEKLDNLIEELINSTSYEQYQSSPTYISEHGHNYFREMDDSMNSLFVLRTQSSFESFRESFQNDSSQNTITVNGQFNRLDTPKALLTFFEKYPELNRAVTINGLASMLINKFDQTRFSKEDVFESYNGLVDTYVDCMSRYCIYKLSNYDLPGKNDFSDLTHTLYMKNIPGRKIVSDDSLFKVYLKELVVPLADVIIS